MCCWNEILTTHTIKNYELIHKNIIQKVDILLKCYINELKDYNYEKYGSIGRMDIIVDNNNVLYILEVNNKQIQQQMLRLSKKKNEET